MDQKQPQEIEKGPLGRLISGAEKMVGFLVILVVVTLVGLIARELFGPMLTKKFFDDDGASRDKVLEGARNGLARLSFPQKVDEHTEVFDAFVSETGEVVFQHRLVKLSDLEIRNIYGSEFESLTMAPTRKKLCADENSKLLFSNGIPIRYQYFDLRDQYVGGFVIGGCDEDGQVDNRIQPIVDPRHASH